MATPKSALPSHIKADGAPQANGEAGAFKRNHHGKSQSHVVSRLFYNIQVSSKGTCCASSSKCTSAASSLEHCSGKERSHNTKCPPLRIRQSLLKTESPLPYNHRYLTRAKRCKARLLAEISRTSSPSCLLVARKIYIKHFCTDISLLSITAATSLLWKDCHGSSSQEY